jgi:predicted deacetylase
MNRNAARYLLRLDDLCPTGRAERWKPLLALVQELGIRPILAVIPQNEDTDLMRGPADSEFWMRLRALEAEGAAIGLHGFRHLPCSHGRSLVPLHRATEFAGASESTQRTWIRTGLAILRSKGLNPKLWVAPRHGFDRTTLRVLKREGIEMLSDGFARRPFVRGGIVWLPQQLWAPMERGPGLWTICIHPDTATESELAALAGFLRLHQAEFVSVEQALQEFPAQPYGLPHMVQGCAALARIQMRRGFRWMRVWDMRSRM